jgi:hypothetical protein
MDDGSYQNSINVLPDLSMYRYEKIFKLYKTGENQYFYNLMQSIFLPDKIDETVLMYMTMKSSEPWTMVSFKAYKTIELWWLILLTNKVYNPFEMPKEGTVIKLIKPEYIPIILKEINATLQ